MVVDILIILTLIIINGFFSMSEIAVVSAKTTALELKEKEGSKGANIALKLKRDSENFLSSVQIGITLISIINGAYGGTKMSVYLVPFIERFEQIAPYADTISFVTVVVVITYLSIVIGELVPKILALSNSTGVAILVARPIHFVSVVFYPLVWFLTTSTNLFIRLMRVRPADDVVSELELRAMLRTASLEGVIEKQENIIHEQVFYFSDKRARHIMTHRRDVEWVDLTQGREKVLSDLLQMRHSRIVVCQGGLDDFVGVVVMRELLMTLHEKGKRFDIRQLVKKPLIVPATLRAHQLLDRFRLAHDTLAVVVDEHGSVDGVATLHDIMEHIVGTLPDVDELDLPDILHQNEYSALISGDAPVEVLTQFIDDIVIDFEEIDYSTVAGFVLAHFNTIPKVGDWFVYQNVEVEIAAIAGNKVEKVLLTRLTDDPNVD